MPWYFIYHLVVFYIESREKKVFTDEKKPKTSVELSNKSRKECCFNRFLVLSSVTYTLILLQCGKPFFSNTHQNGEWTETSTR
jgi:hypothetical protein